MKNWMTIYFTFWFVVAEFERDEDVKLITFKGQPLKVIGLSVLGNNDVIVKSSSWDTLVQFSPHALEAC